LTHTVHKLLSVRLDINPRFVLQFVVYCILFILSAQLLLLHNIRENMDAAREDRVGWKKSEWAMKYLRDLKTFRQ